ncbi:MAG: hypothetical protein IJD04_06155 [Desulfovibrionaceae bacterium]|nr:hypothetical protein [Desulfovibrionaceae bacterium]
MRLEGEQAREDEEKALSELKAEMERLGLQQILHEAAATVGYMGGALVFIDTGELGEALYNCYGAFVPCRLCSYRTGQTA